MVPPILASFDSASLPWKKSPSQSTLMGVRGSQEPSELES